MADVQPRPYDADAPAASEERRLVDHLRRLAHNRRDLFAVHVHLSGLRAGNRRWPFRRIAAGAFEGLVGHYDSALFALSGGDLVLVCRETPVDDVDDAVGRVRQLFGGDPLLAGNGDDRLSTWYDLVRRGDFQSLLDTAEDLAQDAGIRGTADRPPKPMNLEIIERRLETLPLEPLIRRQSAIHILAGASGEVLFHEHYVSMAALRRKVAPDVDLFANRWLFQYLTEVLDRRVLAALARAGLPGEAGAISLNLNVSTLMSAAFQRFQRATGDRMRNLVVEFRLIDVFSDMGAFAYVRDLLQEGGARVLIDGLDPLALGFFDPALLEADLVKIDWEAELAAGVAEDRLAEIRGVIERYGRDDVILARVDSEAAVKWGLGLGIGRFQGHLVDRIAARLAAEGLI
jgi:EAL domain-containing protein (putative c-di-GMP-specific phosphodiesterase class I)